MLDGAILPGGILALQDDQKGAAARRVQQLLRIRKLSREAVEIPVSRLVTQKSNARCRPEGEASPRPRCNSKFLP